MQSSLTTRLSRSILRTGERRHCRLRAAAQLAGLGTSGSVFVSERGSHATSIRGGVAPPSKHTDKRPGGAASMHTPPVEAPEELAGGPVSSAASLLAVELRQGTLSAGGVPLLSRLHADCFVSATLAGSKGLVLGLRASAGVATPLEEVALGQLHCARFLAASRIKIYWMAPAWGSSGEEVPPETQFLLLEAARPGLYAVLLPLLSEGRFRATLRPGRRKRGRERDALRLRIESGADAVRAAQWGSALLVAAGTDPYALVEAAVAAAARVAAGPRGAKPRAAKQLPHFVDLFGWCTWDAFYSKVSAQGVGEGVAALRAGGVAPKFVVIDDGWQRTAAPDVDAEAAQAAQGKGKGGGGRAAVQRQAKADAEKKMLLSLARSASPRRSSSGAALSELANEAAAASPRRTPHPSTASLTGLSRKVEPIAEDGSSSDDEAHSPQGRHQGPRATAPPGAVNVEVSLATGKSGPPASKAGAGAAARAARPGPPPDAAAFPAALCWGDFQGKVLGLLAVTATTLYTRLIEHAPPGSLRIRLFERLVSGTFKRAMLSFYDQTSDHTRRMTGIEANAKFGGPATGPDEPLHGGEGLRDVVSELKGAHGVEQVLIWHSLQGYWAGIARGVGAAAASLPVDIIFPRPSAGVLEVDPCFAWNCQVLAGVGVTPDVARLYAQMHGYLAGAGVDGLKVDCQSTLDMMGGAAGQGGASEMSGEYHAALERSVAHHFPGNAVINCMCHSTNDLYRLADTALARSSDDFWPRDPASHTTHVAVNAYNSLFLAPLVQPDWDMFHSEHPAALLHATARVVSGGPLYVSDRPGRHDFALLRRLVLPDGRVLRCTEPGRPAPDSLFADVMRDRASLLKVFNRTACGAVVAAFNLQGAAWDRALRQFRAHDPRPPTLAAPVGPRDVPGWARASGAHRFVLWSDAQQEAWAVGPDESVPVRLAPGRSDLMTLQPLYHLGGGDWAGPIGLVNMLNTGAAVTAVEALGGREGGSGCSSSASPANGAHANGAGAQPPAPPAAALAVGVRGAGTLLLYSTLPPRSCALDGKPSGFEYKGETRLVRVPVPHQDSLQSRVVLQF